MAEVDPRLQYRPGPSSSDIEGTLSDLMDLAFGNVQGTICQRNADGWRPLAPGNLGDVYNSGGPGGDNFWAPGAQPTYLAPAFTSFTITGQATPIEVGATIASGNKTFTWSTSNSGNVSPNTISIVDTTGSTTLASGLANDGSEVISISAITNSVPASQVWTISGTNTHSASFSRAFTVNWLWRIYAGTNAAATLTGNQIKALSDFSGLQAGFAGTYSIVGASSVYYYFSYPDSLGSVSNFVDANTGFPISMATVSDDAAYSNVANGWYYDLVSVTNAQSVATNYRVYRTTFQFSGTLLMRVT